MVRRGHQQRSLRRPTVAATLQTPLFDSQSDPDPLGCVRDAKQAAKSLADRVGERRRLDFARSFAQRVAETYWRTLQCHDSVVLTLAPPFVKGTAELSPESMLTADALAAAAAAFDPTIAGYFIGTAYAAMLPADMRVRLGAYYTPPALTAELLNQATAAGIDWASASVLDPACGGGAFLAPVAERIVKHLSHLEADAIIAHVASHLRGFEIDPFAAWLAHVSLEAVLLPLCRESGQRIETLIDVRDSLCDEPKGRRYDLVIGNPPYGRVTLPTTLRRRYERSVYGHANLYGVFTDLALRWVADNGVVSFVTPTSFLTGQYFSRLRTLLGQAAPPAFIDFIAERKGVFDDVLQETLLATYRHGDSPDTVPVRFITCVDEVTLRISGNAAFSLPADTSTPWLMPRGPDVGPLVDRLRIMPHRLRDWGYGVSTGPLVWNRYKTQLRRVPGDATFPLLWAEVVTSDGGFIFRADKRHHQPYFLPRRGDDWLVVREPVVLLQRTTAKEQSRRLIATMLPPAFLRKHRGVVIENHLNMVRARTGRPLVAAAVLAAFLNSAAADNVFRCLNGSVAVSAYELEAMPVPAPSAVTRLTTLVTRGATRAEIGRECERLYGGDVASHD